jgi:type III secretory pathway component EscV
MPFVIVVVGVLLVVAAVNNSYPALGQELKTDIPDYFKLGIAIVAILGLGYIPGFKTPSRWLLALFLITLFIAKWQTIVQGFQTFAQGSAAPTGTAAAVPTAAYVAANAPEASASSTATASTGTDINAATAKAGNVLTAAQSLAANPLNPNAYVGLAAGFGGLA